MTESFDPYHKLLGISKRDQPPTLYRLLGLEDLESDREVIDAAANKQMSYLQSCCNGDHAASAEGLMNEVSIARLRLLNPQSKDEYDEQLRATESRRHAAEPAPLPQQPAALTQSPINPVLIVDGPRVRASHRGPKKRSGGSSWVYGTISSMTLIWVAWMMGYFGGSPESEPETKMAAIRNLETSRAPLDQSTGAATPRSEMSRSTAGVRNGSAPSNASPTESLSRPQNRSQSPPPASRQMETRTTPQANRQQPTRAFSLDARERMEGFRSLAKRSDAGGSRLEKSPGMDDGLADGANADSRLPVPDEDELVEAVAEVQVTLASQIKAAKTPHEKQHLGKVIDDLALETKRPAARYALLKTALETFTQAGDFNGAMLAIDQMHGQFRISGLEQRLPVMRELQPMLYRPLDQVAMADQAEVLIDHAMVQEDYAAASELCAIGKKLSRDLRNRDMAKKFALRSDEIETLQSQHPTVVLARQRLASEPDNVKANEFLGRFLCFGKSQWNDGLPYLGRGEDPAIRELATAEMQPPATVTEMEQLADRWWEFYGAAENQTMVARTSHQRAMDWYRRAIAHGLSGLAKAAAEKRIASAQAEPGSDLAIARTPNAEQGEPKRPRGVPANAIYFNGNWYLFSERQVNQPEAIVIAQKAGGRPVVVRSQAEHDFLVTHAKGTLMLGMVLRDGVWYDALNERQYFFLWDTKSRQPEPLRNEAWAAIDQYTSLWHDFNIRRMYFVIEWGRE